MNASEHTTAGRPTIVDASALINIDPDLRIPADGDRGNGFLRAVRILFPQSA